MKISRLQYWTLLDFITDKHFLLPTYELYVSVLFLRFLVYIFLCMVFITFLKFFKYISFYFSKLYQNYSSSWETLFASVFGFFGLNVGTLLDFGISTWRQSKWGKKGISLINSFHFNFNCCCSYASSFVSRLSLSPRYFFALDHWKFSS